MKQPRGYVADDFSPTHERMGGPHVRVIADSYYRERPNGGQKHRLITVECTFHRFILAEVNTHRASARNSASSRAIPLKKQRGRVRANPALPERWGANQAGMQAAGDLTGWRLYAAKTVWAGHRWASIGAHSLLERIGLHKQWANRLIEPHMWHSTVWTGTAEAWRSVFDQRCHPDAQPEFRVLAEAIREAIQGSHSRMLSEDGWHLPYVRISERHLPIEEQIQLSVARCARVSFTNHAGLRDLMADFDLFKKLRGQDPGHFSPMEHQARPLKLNDARVGCHRGWMTYRHDLYPAFKEVPYEEAIKV